MALITFNTSGSGSKSGRINIPADYLRSLEINENNREVNIYLRDNKIIIEKVKSNENI